MGASFGGGSGQTVFGSDGPLPLLNKVTTFGAIIFMVTSVALAYNSAHLNKGSVMKGVRTVPISKPLVNKAPVEIPIPSQDQTSKPVTQNTTKADTQFPRDTTEASHKSNQKTPAQPLKVPATDKKIK